MMSAISATATRPEPTISALRRLSSRSHSQSSLGDASIERPPAGGSASTGETRLRSASSPRRSTLGKDPITHHPTTEGSLHFSADINQTGVAADRAGMALLDLDASDPPSRHRLAQHAQNHRSGTRMTSPGSTSVSSVTNSSSAKFEKKRRI